MKHTIKNGGDGNGGNGEEEKERGLSKEARMKEMVGGHAFCILFPFAFVEELGEVVEQWGREKEREKEERERNVGE